jgi:hypothetical protein
MNRVLNHNEAMAIMVSAICAVMLTAVVILSFYWDLAR